MPRTRNAPGKRKRPATWLRAEHAPWLVGGTVLLFTLSAGLFMSQLLAERDDGRFRNAVQGARDRVADRLATYVAALRGAAGLFAASDEVSWAEFEAYLTRLDVEGHYPGVQGVGYARRVPHDSLDEVTDRVRAEVAQSFQIWPDSLRAEYFPIVYLHPLDARNLAALGFDMFSEPVRREAMERTRDTGEPALSGHVVLKQEIDEREVQPGFLLYQAVYDESGPVRTAEERRQRIEGFVYSPFRADDLFEGIFGTEQPRVAFRVYDGAHEDPGALLHSSSPPGLWPQHPSFRQSLSLEVAGRAWRLEFVSLPAFATTWG